MDLNEIRVFVKVVQAGSFSRAAQSLTMPKSTVSTKVSQLEARLGITLLQRTTRKLNLTAAGEMYFRRCAEALDGLQSAETEATAAQSFPQGLLRITAPIDMGNTLLTDLVREYTRKHPKVSVDLLFTDRIVDLIAEGVDLALRAGDLEDSSLVARKLGYSHFAPFAHPTYLKKASAPSHPRDLMNHPCLRFTALDLEGWFLTNGREKASIKVKGPISTNDLFSLKTLTLAGHGIAMLPMFLCREELRKQKLVRVLPEWFSHPDPVHLVFPGQRFASPKLQAFLEMASDPLKAVFSGKRV